MDRMSKFFNMFFIKRYVQYRGEWFCQFDWKHFAFLPEIFEIEISFECHERNCVDGLTTVALVHLSIQHHTHSICHQNDQELHALGHDFHR